MPRRLAVIATGDSHAPHAGHGGSHGAHSTGGKTPTRVAEEVKATKPPEVRTIEIGVISSGFDPAELRLTRGEKVDRVFTRTAQSSCATILRIKDLGITRELPFDESVTVRLQPAAAGRIDFGCPSGAVKGALIVEQRVLCAPRAARMTGLAASRGFQPPLSLYVTEPVRSAVCRYAQDPGTFPEKSVRQEQQPRSKSCRNCAELSQ